MIKQLSQNSLTACSRREFLLSFRGSEIALGLAGGGAQKKRASLPPGRNALPCQVGGRTLRHAALVSRLLGILAANVDLPAAEP